MTRSLPDLCDQYPEIVSVATPIFYNFGKRHAFSGPIRTIKCFEDNSFVADQLEEEGDGSVLVVDGGGSRRCALVGDNLARNAHENGWSGIVVFGCVRDSSILAEIDIGVQAIDRHPLRSIKKGVGERNLVLKFANVTWVPGQYVYCDEDGVVVTPCALD